MSKEPIDRIDSVELTHQLDRPNGPVLISAEGHTEWSGWYAAKLKLVNDELAPGGVLHLSFVANPPDGISVKHRSPMTAQFHWTGDVEQLRSVIVKSKTNNVEKLLKREASGVVLAASGPQARSFERVGITAPNNPRIPLEPLPRRSDIFNHCLDAIEMAYEERYPDIGPIDPARKPNAIRESRDINDWGDIFADTPSQLVLLRSAYRGLPIRISINEIRSTHSMQIDNVARKLRSLVIEAYQELQGRGGE